MSKNVKLFNDRVLLRLSKESDKPKSGIILNASTQSAQEAIVVACSDGFYTDGTFVPLNVKNNDTVLINNGTGQKLRIDGEDFVLVHEHEILLIYG